MRVPYLVEVVKLRWTHRKVRARRDQESEAGTDGDYDGSFEAELLVHQWLQMYGAVDVVA